MFFIFTPTWGFFRWVETWNHHLETELHPWFFGMFSSWFAAQRNPLNTGSQVSSVGEVAKRVKWRCFRLGGCLILIFPYFWEIINLTNKFSKQVGCNHDLSVLSTDLFEMGRISWQKPNSEDPRKQRNAFRTDSLKQLHRTKSILLNSCKALRRRTETVLQNISPTPKVLRWFEHTWAMKKTLVVWVI